MLSLPGKPGVPEHVVKMALLRGALDFIASNLFYFACSELPLALATVIYFTNPFWAGLLAKYFLGEMYDSRHYALLCLGTFGTVVALWPELHAVGGTPSMHGLVAAFVGSIFQASQYVAGRALCNHKLHWLYQAAAYSCAGGVLGPLALAACALAGYSRQRVVPLAEMTPHEAAMTMGTVMCALVAQMWLIHGMALIPVTLTSMIRTLDVPMAFLWAIALLHAWPHPFQVTGGCILVWACIMQSRIKKK